MKTAVIAIGGNAILPAGKRGTKEEHLKHIKITCKHLVEMIKEGYDIVLTHGNGPQIGNIVIQNEFGKNDVPAMPLDVCGAETQGEIGYLIQQTLTNELKNIGIRKTVVSLVTQILVDKNDPAFKNPSKPIGPYYNKEEVDKLMQYKDWKMVFDEARKGWRRVVSSPIPLDIIEKDAIMSLIFSGKNSKFVVIASGGGGIPVINTENGYEGVEAVVDKDLAGSILAISIKEKFFIMLTDVVKVAINFGKPEQKDLSKMNVMEAKNYFAQGHFHPGSMGPKIRAAISFLENGGEKVIITSPENLLKAIKGEEGTHILKV